MFGACRARLESCCCRFVYVVCVVAKKTSVAGGECERTRHNALAWIRLPYVPELVFVFLVSGLESLRNFDGRRSTITSLASWRLCSSEPKRRRCRALARVRGDGRFLFFRFFCAALGAARSCAARSCGGALLMMACAPCSALCARLGVAYALLGAVCAARRCARSALYSVLIVCITQQDTDVVFLCDANSRLLLLARRCFGSSDEPG